MPWLVLALLASLLWGLSYVLDEHIFQRISVSTLLFFSAFATLITMLLVGLGTGQLQRDLTHLSETRSTFWLLLLACACNVLAGWSICQSVAASNATLAGLIEVSYPVWIVLFSLAFGSAHLNWSIGVGGALIGLGVVIVQWGAR